jgi:hypothetical protein
VAPAACLIESNCCGRVCRESARAEPTRSRMGLDAVSLLRRIGWLRLTLHLGKLNAGWALLGCERMDVLSTKIAIDQRARSLRLGLIQLPFIALGQCESTMKSKVCNYEVQGLRVTVATVFKYFSGLHHFEVRLGVFV